MNTALRPEDWSVMVSPSAAASAALQGALLESRQRWQDLATLAADLVFETDNDGCFTFLWPETVCGHRSAALLGRRADSLLLGSGPGPFALRRPVRNQRVWVAAADGRARCLSVSLAPLGDKRGVFAGLRGAAHDVTDQEMAAAAAASSLRRAALLNALSEEIRCAQTTAAALACGLTGIRDSMGCEGAALLSPGGRAPVVDAATAPPPDALIEEARRVLTEENDWLGRLPDTTPALVFQHRGRPPAVSALVAWRQPGGRDWDAEDLTVLRSMAALLGAVHGFAKLEAELERRARTDPLTGLDNRRAFLEALAGRLGGEGAPRPGGALLFLDLDNLKPLNDEFGHEAGDLALRTTARLLRNVVGAGDLVARFGGDEFVLWLDGADAHHAIRQAETLLATAAALPAAGPAPRYSIGIAVRPPGPGESVMRLLARADAALYDAKRSSRGSWRLSEVGP